MHLCEKKRTRNDVSTLKKILKVTQCMLFDIGFKIKCGVDEKYKSKRWGWVCGLKTPVVFGGCYVLLQPCYPGNNSEAGLASSLKA